MPRRTQETTGRQVLFAYRAVTFCGAAFQLASAKDLFCNSLAFPQKRLVAPTTPDEQRLRAITPTGFRLIPVRSPLLRESRLLSFPRVTKMFQFTRLPSLPYLFRQR